MRKLVLILLGLLLTACNLPLTNPEDDLNNQAATLVALTLNAVSATPTFTNTPLSTPTLSITRTPTPTITPTYSVPMLKINEPTNCRTGPGQSYDLLFTFNAGASVEILGQYPTNNYWTVKWQGGEGFCWVWGEYATATGSYWTVPTVNPPPTALPSPPAAPGLPANAYTFECTFNGITTRITWSDRAENEQGYRVYRDNEFYILYRYIYRKYN
jgi:hypothetical protein